MHLQTRMGAPRKCHRSTISLCFSTYQLEHFVDDEDSTGQQWQMLASSGRCLPAVADAC